MGSKPAPKKDILSEHLDLKHVAKSVISGQRFLAKFGKISQRRRNTLDLMFGDVTQTVITQQKVLRKFRKPKIILEPGGLHNAGCNVASSDAKGQRFLEKFGKTPRKNTLDFMFPNVAKTVLTEQKVLRKFRKPNKPVSPPARRQSEAAFRTNTIVIMSIH